MYPAIVLAVSLAALASCSWLPRPVTFHDPLTPAEHVVLGQTYVEQGDRDAAVHEFEAAVKRDAQHVPALLALGNVAFERQSWSDAETYYRRAVQLNPNHAAAANNLAMVYVTTGQQLDEAERLARHALNQDATLTPYISETLATLYVKQGRLREAKAALEAAEAAMGLNNAILRERLGILRQEITTSLANPVAR